MLSSSCATGAALFDGLGSVERSIMMGGTYPEFIFEGIADFDRLRRE